MVTKKAAAPKKPAAPKAAPAPKAKPEIKASIKIEDAITGALAGVIRKMDINDHDGIADAAIRIGTALFTRLKK